MVTNYVLPFPFEAPSRNPWEQSNEVRLSLETVAPLSAADMEVLEGCVLPFWFLASSGALFGGTGQKHTPIPEAPAFSGKDRSFQFTFQGWNLDERASQCLLCLLLAAHEDLPLKQARLSIVGKAPPKPITIDPLLDAPYPQAPSHPPFAWTIEDSESETRELHIRFVERLSDEQRERIEGELDSVGIALAVGAYGVTPVPPRECGCLPSEEVSFSGDELDWLMEDCRFHPAALEGLIGVCASLHHHVATIREVTIS
ncbi:hypothetical protein [Myxococcus landrumensis]|uniref:Uncharacterized protein n=1 Tax=Myxococcus landrumensis TaxID=2813577 RepID=A0ABX7N1Y4_9BACT|nr:hypothetical protein [Myxococcus landrumus]QSQ11722.1 hypothetical protein JY572_25410 [Myxococcus landrumus]